MSIRNGTALAIVLSISFVLVSVAIRDSLPDLAGNDVQSVSTVGIDQGNLADSTETSAASQVGQQASVATGAPEATEAEDWNADVSKFGPHDENVEHDDEEDEDRRSVDQYDDRDKGQEGGDDDN